MIKQILVPVDFSAESLYALKHATVLARRFRARLRSLFVIEPIYSAMPVDFPTPTSVNLLEKQRKTGREQLRKLVTRLVRRGVSARAFLDVGSPHVQIVKQAERLRTDMIVMGTQGRTGLSRLLMGSVAERVVRHAPCAVLTVRKNSRASRRRKRPDTLRRQRAEASKKVSTNRSPVFRTENARFANAERSEIRFSHQQ